MYPLLNHVLPLYIYLYIIAWPEPCLASASFVSCDNYLQRWEKIHKTDDKKERGDLKLELKELRHKLNFDSKHRVYAEVCQWSEHS